MTDANLPEYIQDPESWHMREVYASFGAAVYFAQVLEAQVVNHLVFLRAERHKRGKSFDVDDVFRRLFGQTLGRNVGEIRAVLRDDEWPVADELADALGVRNELIHHYWRRRILKTGTEQGRQEMIDELDAVRARFEDVDQRLTAETMALWDKHGLDVEWLGREYSRLTEVSRGQREPDPDDELF
jgi:hypothetical protein